MEEIVRTIEENKEALDRVMKVKANLESSTITFGSMFWLKRLILIFLWLLTGMALLFAVVGLFSGKVKGLLTFEVVMVLVSVLGMFLIRGLSYKKTVNLVKATFEFKGQLRKNRVYTLADYVGTETRRTIKDFPEEFRVRFMTANGTKSYKLADLNMGYARNIEPNYEAVKALWDVIIKQMQSKYNRQHESNNNYEVVPDTDEGM